MPSATSTKSAMAGTKRKSASGKEPHVKEPKKPKTDAAVKPAMKKTKSVPVKRVEESNDSEDSDTDMDGGVPLDHRSGEDSDVDMDEDDENLPKATDGLHPERAKAVNVNSM